MAQELAFFLTGGASNTSPNNSLGGSTSDTGISAAAVHNLFDIIVASEIAVVPRVEYRAISIKNIGDANAQYVHLYMVDTESVYSTVSLWYDSTGTQSIANELVEPIGASWTQPSEGSLMYLPTLIPAQECRVWVRRTVLTIAKSAVNDLFTLYVNYI